MPWAKYCSVACRQRGNDKRQETPKPRQVLTLDGMKKPGKVAGRIAEELAFGTVTLPAETDLVLVRNFAASICTPDAIDTYLGYAGYRSARDSRALVAHPGSRCGGAGDGRDARGC